MLAVRYRDRVAENREVLFTRVTPELKRRVEQLAARLGISTSAAVAVLLTEALDERDRDGRAH